jgi:hypothetical protein
MILYNINVYCTYVSTVHVTIEGSVYQKLPDVNRNRFTHPSQVKVKVKFTPEQATKTQRGSTGIALLSL